MIFKKIGAFFLIYIGFVLIFENHPIFHHYGVSRPHMGANSTRMGLETLRKSLAIKERDIEMVVRMGCYVDAQSGCGRFCVVQDEDFFLDHYENSSACIKELFTFQENKCQKGGFIVAIPSRRARLNIPNPRNEKILDPENALTLSELYPDFPKEEEAFLKEPRPLLW
jgi:hypothetical protein